MGWPAIRIVMKNKPMNAHDYLGVDGHTILLLCSSLALPPTSKETDLTPLKLSEWNQLERKIRESPLENPAALQGRSADELAKALALPTGQAEQIARLLGFAGRLSGELENFFADGLWAVTRADEVLPAAPADHAETSSTRRPVRRGRRPLVAALRRGGGRVAQHR